MDETLSEIIKDLSEALLAIVSTICIIVKTANEVSSKRSRRKRRRKK
ncbi:MAG: hypothetical protein ACI4F9_01025 [Lachnospiraceae bacterium]